MKNIILWALCLSNFAFGLEVLDVGYDSNGDILEVEVAYVGGCVEHKFQLEFVECALSKVERMGMVNICSVQIRDTTQQEDVCTSVVTKALRISLEGLKGDKRPAMLGFNETHVVLVPRRS